MSPSLQRARIFLVAGATSAYVAVGCGSSHGSSPSEDAGTDGSGGTTTASSSTGSSGSSSSSSSGLDAGSDGGDSGCVFETVVTGIVTSPSSATPVPCNAPLCGCTDNGMLITTVPGSF